MSIEIQSIIQMVETQLGASSVQESDRIVEDLGADSMDIVNIVTDVEERYSILIDEAELPNISTVSDLINLAARHLNSVH